MATSEETVCPICVDCFTTPKVIWCGHSYCLACLRTYVGNKKNQFDCAVCRKLVEIPDGGIETFPTNYAIGNRESIVKTDSKCINHAQKDAECYCRKCEVGLCYKCLYTKHKDHDYFDSESEAGRVIVLEEVSQYEQNIRHRINEMRNVSDNLSNTITKFSHDTCEEVERVKNELITEIEQTTETTKSLIIHTSGQKLLEITKNEKQICKRVGEVEEKMNRILSTSSNASLLTQVQRLSKLKQLHAEMKETEKLSEVEGLEWIRNTVDIPESFGTVQSKPLLLLNAENSRLLETKEESDSSQEGCFGGEQHIQFSFRFNFDPNVFEAAKTRVQNNSGEEIYMYFSQDKYCASALRKLTWSCFLKQFDNGAIGVYVVLMADENDQIKHCVIDYKLSLHHSDTEYIIIKQALNKKFTVDNANGGGNGSITKIINHLQNIDSDFEIQFDIIKIREIVTI